MVVVSAPAGRFTPSERVYQEMERKALADPEKDPLPPRYSMVIESQRRFRLRRGDGPGRVAGLYGDWPRSFAAGGGFYSVQRTYSRSEHIDPRERRLFAVAFVVDPAEADGPIRVQFDDDPPVDVPALWLEVPRTAERTR